MEKSEALSELSIDHEVEEIATEGKNDYTFAFQFSFDSENGGHCEEWLFDVTVSYRAKSDSFAFTAAMPEGAAKNFEAISDGTTLSVQEGKTLLARVVEQASQKHSIIDEVNKLIDDTEEFISPE